MCNEGLHCEDTKVNSTDQQQNTADTLVDSSDQQQNTTDAIVDSIGQQQNVIQDLAKWPGFKIVGDNIDKSIFSTI